MSIFKLDIGPGLTNFRAREKENPSELIEHLSSQRKNQIETFFPNNKNKILELERQFGKYLLIPLALPKFELPDLEMFKHWWSKHSISPEKLVSETLSPEVGYSSAECVDLIEKIQSRWTPNMQTDNFKKTFPKLWDQFHDLLPIDEFLNLHLWSSVMPFKEHRDPGEVVDIPVSFRIMLYDDNPEETLYIFENTTMPYEYGEIKQPPRLEDTNTWIWNNLRVKHGSIYNPGYRKCMALSTGVINIKKYESLLNASIAKYKEHCIVSNNSLENFVNV
jgi:hypothetical protein